MKHLVVAVLMAGLSHAAYAGTSGLCMVSASHNDTRAAESSQLTLRQGDCDGKRGCNSSDNSNIAWSRWSGISSDVLAHEGAQADARLAGDAGEIECNGTVHDGVLAGRYVFTPNTGFQQQMTAMGFADLNADKLQAFVLLDVSKAWVEQMKSAGVTNLTTDHLIAMRALNAGPDFVRAMARAGYPELAADKLIEMKAVGVTPERADEAKALGFRPSEQELVQMTIFKIDRPFIERMRAKGLTNLTVAKLVQVKIFKLDE